MTPALLEAILDHARAETPREACGVLIWDGANDAIYRPCLNVAEGDDHFQIDPEDWVAAEDAGPVLGIVHSHPGGTVEPSPADLLGISRSGVPWWIVTPEGDWKRYTPPSWKVLGHPFAWGVSDCLTLARDCYAGIPDAVRGSGFWRLHDLFTEGIGAAHFEVVTDGPEPDDLLLMSIRGLVDGVKVPNHCAVYVGSGRIAHHMPGRFSREEDMGPLGRAVVATLRRTHAA